MFANPSHATANKQPIIPEQRDLTMPIIIADGIVPQPIPHIEFAPEKPIQAPQSLPILEIVPITPQDYIHKWAAHFGANEAQLLRVAQCESKFNLHAHNPSGATGLFQFLPSTWRAWYPRAGAGGDIYSANDQARTAAYMFSVGEAGQWSCK